ncbi:MAG: hypothetical protein KDE27_16220 [Planctomycetes bacterium]|nr:hypothetical protein [Planctomycetota bacterium]
MHEFLADWLQAATTEPRRSLGEAEPRSVLLATVFGSGLGGSWDERLRLAGTAVAILWVVGGVILA